MQRIRERTTNIGLYLHLAAKNISALRRLSENYGIGHCCIGKLEERQRTLENALVRHGGNLGLLPVLIVGAAAVMGIGSLITAVWWHYRDTKVALETQENIRVAMENGIDPGSFCPVAPESPTSKLIETIRGVIILGAIGMLIIMFMKKKK